MLFGKHINKFYKIYFWFFFFGILALIIVNYAQLLIPEIFGNLIDAIENETIFTNRELLNKSVMMIGIIAIVMFAGRFTWRYCIFGVGIRIEADLRDMMFSHSEKLSNSYYKEHKTGALMALYTNDLQTIRAFFGQGTIMLIDFIFLGAIALTKMFILNYILTFIVLIPAIIIGILTLVLGKKMEEKFKIRQKAYEDLSDFTQENFSGISVIKAFVKEEEEIKSFGEINLDNYNKNMNFLRYYMILSVCLTLVINIIMAIICAGGTILITGDRFGFTIGDLTEYISYFSTLTWPMMAIGQLINLRSQAKASLTRVEELLNEKPQIVDVEQIIDSKIKGEITFNNLNFKYPDGDDLVLKNITFTIKQGEMVGILGKTGSGKSTLVDLLLRIHNIDNDSIYLDNVDIMKISFKKVRDAIGYVPQDNFLFSDTIRNNIAFALNDINEEDIEKSAILSDVHDNIMEFKMGYDTILGERGVTLSGGQKQRVSIARALIKNPPIMIFDDSVSAVDTKTEEKILNNLRNLRKNKTTLMISHRISTVKDLDKIILIDKGMIAGIGTHSELLANNSLYQEMVHLQALESEVNA